MIRASRLVLLLAAGLSSGCATQDLRGPSSTCEVHGIRMRSVTTPLHVGWVDHFDPSYSDASHHLFPHAPPEGPEDKWRRERIYVCDECIRAREEWLERHREACRITDPTRSLVSLFELFHASRSPVS